MFEETRLPLAVLSIILLSYFIVVSVVLHTDLPIASFIINGIGMSGLPLAEVGRVFADSSDLEEKAEKKEDKADKLREEAEKKEKQAEDQEDKDKASELREEADKLKDKAKQAQKEADKLKDKAKQAQKEEEEEAAKDAGKLNDKAKQAQKEENQEKQAEEEKEEKDVSKEENKEEKKESVSESVSNHEDNSKPYGVPTQSNIENDDKDGKDPSTDTSCDDTRQENCDSNIRNCEEVSESSNDQKSVCSFDSSKAKAGPQEKIGTDISTQNEANLNLPKNEKSEVPDYDTSKIQVNNSENAVSIFEGQNLSAISAAAANNNDSTILDISSKTNSSSAPLSEQNINFACDPNDLEIVQGAEGTMTCTIENNGPNATEIYIGCSGLVGTGIECFIDGADRQKDTFLVKGQSDKKVPITIVSRSSPPASAGSYPFVISGDCTSDSDNPSC